MPRVALSLAVALMGASLAACAVSGSVSTGTGSMSSGTGPQGKPARPGESAEPGASGAVASDAAGAAKAGPPPCQPALADTPTALFGTRIVVRLPKGVELAEQNPFFAQAVAPNQATSCGQPVSYAAFGFFEYPNASTTVVRDQVLELRGIPAGAVTWEDEGTRGRTYTGAYSAPADEASGAPAVRGWFVLRDATDKYGYFALYETDPASWDALKGVFVASGRSLLVKPRALSSAAEGQIAAPPPAGGASATGSLSAEPAAAKGSKGSKATRAAKAD